MPSTTADRKKAFKVLFKNRIVPFFEAHGFARYSPTRQAFFKKFEKGLSVFIYLEFKNFGSGFYDLSVAYYDEGIGNADDDRYLAIAQIRTPVLKGATEAELDFAINSWTEKLKVDLFPFIEQHSSHAAILASTQFYYAPSSEAECKKLLREKSI